MTRKILLALAFVLLCSHDMYLKPVSYFLEPGTESRIALFNGTFEKSENVIARSRMQDVSLVGNGRRTALDSTQWREQDSVTILNFTSGEPGTWVAGVSTLPRNIEMAAEDFNAYLEHDGILDMLKERRNAGTLGEDAVERYSKHVKTIFQVGEALSADWNHELGYPLEFIPMENPYDIHPGHRLQVRLLRDGSPLADQLVYVGARAASHTHEDGGEVHSDEADTGAHTHEAGGEEHTHGPGEEVHSHSGDGSEGHQHDGIRSLRTDSEGLVTLDIDAAGVWYLRTIHLVDSPEEGLTHESNWATLTFAIGEGHSHSHGDADSAHTHEDEGIPAYLLWIGSLLILGILFFFFNRRKR
ncbi:DUF4198 domain-containing protein [Robiginitalea sp. SC105]|uniref:DUF4198 domain-containing protein n=1 Tax=Robiginitalea sp. SC105 TaxID=2762332 RepID=UPI00163AE732|nr:DUF4198 domain-containing protein [Robiginitalea sp. SC105]MBC2838454.1 DUF4198 domain-containing protein [Robiginitalea sp. SC105]